MSDKAFGVACDDCGAILREFRDAVHLDDQELKKRVYDAADASGRTPDQMRLAWVSSVALMTIDEMHTVMRAQYPRMADIRRKQEEHESRTGHSVFRDGWKTMRMPYEELLKVMRVVTAIRER